jgi:hypothetical protein
MIFKRKPPATVPTMRVGDFNPRRRLSNLQRARVRVSNQLANPHLQPEHRPDIERKLDSIDEEIEQLKVVVG